MLIGDERDRIDLGHAPVKNFATPLPGNVLSNLEDIASVYITQFGNV